MQKIQSQMEAYEVAQQIIDGMDIGQTVGLNAITLTKLGESQIVVSGSEYNYKIGNGQNADATMYSIELADFIFFPERKRINDAMERF